MKTLDETIKYYEELAEEQEKEYLSHAHDEEFLRSISHTLEAQIKMYSKNGCKRHAEEYRQLAEWLKELKAYKKAHTVISELRDWHLTDGNEMVAMTISMNTLAIIDKCFKEVNADENGG